jgi:DNA (cytosine-5)-methyltransferase 1
MRYLSLFSGVGGLEFRDIHPSLACEIDPSCHPVLQNRFPGLAIHPDVQTLRPPKTDVVAGGWPCQDISVAGLRAGLNGKNSGLFFHLVRVASEAGAETVVAENVPNLLAMQDGALMRQVVDVFRSQGWPCVSWRILNARSFGLPQQRNRLIIVASKHREIALHLFRPVPSRKTSKSERKAAGFYTTAGSRSLCYNFGYVPTVKVGSAISIPSPPGLHYGEIVRKATALECIRFQGFDPKHFKGIKDKDVYRMMGNAVAVPVGQFAMETVLRPSFVPEMGKAYLIPMNDYPVHRNGFHDGDLYEVFNVDNGVLSADLDRFIEREVDERISQRAAAGLVRRLHRSGVYCPPELFRLLQHYGEVSLAG